MTRGERVVEAAGLDRESAVALYDDEDRAMMRLIAALRHGASQT